MKKLLLLSPMVILLVFVGNTQAALLAPYFDLTINVISEGGDEQFTFHTQQKYVSSIDTQTFYIQTQNGQGSYFLPDAVGNNIDYYDLYEDLTDDWVLKEIQCESKNPQITFQNHANGIFIAAKPYSEVSCSFINIKKSNKTPVLIIPGVLGTDILKNNEKLWLNLPKNLSDVGDEFMDSLGFYPDLKPLDPSLDVGSLILNPLLGQHFYDLIINEFANQGYIENTDLFTFPYDWRYGVTGQITDGTTTVDLLKSKIDSILEQTHSDKINIVAHSTGGLLVKKYVMEHPSDHHIDKAVFVGVPNTGAPKAIKALLQGDNFDIPWLADSEIKKIAQNLPVIYDLAPTAEYYNNKGSFYKLTEIKSLLTTTVTDLNYDQAWQLMLNEHGANSLGVNNAQSLHSGSFDNYDLRTAGINAYNIVGCKTATISKIKEIHYKNFAGQPSVDYSAPEESPGDGTVPLESATNFPVNQDHKFYALKADHSKMPSQNGIRQTIVNLLTDSRLAVSQKDITQDPAKCKLNGKAIEIFSPVDINITDQDGNHLGLAADGSTQNDVTNADFEIWNGHKFIFLPTDENQTYDIKLKGTGEGRFTLKTQDIINNQTSETRIFSNLPVSLNLLGAVNINAPTTTLDLDYNGDGEIDQTILPSSILGQNQSRDLVPPVSTSTLQGIMGEPGFYRSGVNINLSAEDPVITGHEPETSGVLSTTYELDGQGEQVYSGPINISNEGAHTLTFFSTDRAGNNEQPQTLTFTIDTTPPEFAMQFNPDKRDLDFWGTDNLSLPEKLGLEDQGDSLMLTDEAGNSTALILSDKNRKISSRTQIKSINYNGVVKNSDPNALNFTWLYNKKGDLKFLSQSIRSKQNFNVIGLYLNNKTTFLGRDQSGKIFKTAQGLRLLQVTTQNGDLNWNIQTE